MMGGFSTFHWLIVALIAFMLFGNRLPTVMRSLGQSITEFKKGISDDKKED
jgi:sec-independent protein translocase protein TatA